MNGVNRVIENYPRIQNISIAGLKQSEFEALTALSEEIRTFLINELSNTGGHLASNLGVVELTIALFRVFNSPEDKFIWDIGHQAYVHKIITGRASQFDTLRQYEGLSGFIKRSESCHDIWEAGHASTSLSAATGLTVDNALSKKQDHVISIIGDGALTGGMALEALNHIGDLGLPQIIILNDNNMSISENVGALNRHINELRINPTYVSAKKNTKYVLSKIKTPGKIINDSLRWMKRKVKSFMLLDTNNTFFDTMGIDYLGPIDGHNIEQLEDALNLAKTRKRPVVLHVLTIKGKGFNPAEQDARGAWHGIGPYDLASGQKIRKDDRTLRQWSSVVSETIERFAQTDPAIVAVTPAMLKGSKLDHFAKKFPDRTFDVGIAEEHAMTFAAGLALTGTQKPFIAIYSTFIQRAYDQLLHDVARQKLKVVIGIDRCGFAGGDGETHHGIYDISILQTIPNIVIAMGKDAIETQQLLYSAFYAYDFAGPIAIRYPRGYTYLRYVHKFNEIPLGTWEYMQQQDTATSVILAFGPQLVAAMAVAEELAKDGIIVDVVNARFIKPMDTTMLDAFTEQYTSVITIEEASRNGGFGQGVLSYFHQKGHFAMHTHIFAIDDVYIEQGNNAQLLEEAKIDIASIVTELRGRKI